MAANFTNFVRILGTLGGEEKKMEAERTLANVTTVVADVTTVLAAAAVGSPTTLWTGTGHGGASPSSEFGLLAFMCDPDNLLTTDQQVDLELAFTDVSGTVTTKVFLCNKSVPFLIGNSVVRGAITTARVTTEHITRVRALNFTGNSTETVRLLLLRV